MNIITTLYEIQISIYQEWELLRTENTDVDFSDPTYGQSLAWAIEMRHF